MVLQDSPGASAASDSSRIPLMSRAQPALVGWASARWLVLTIAAIMAPIAVLAVASSLSLWGRPIPGFLVLDRAVIFGIGLESWTGPRSGVPFNAIVLKADDRPVNSAADVYDHVRDTPIGTAITYELAKDGRVFSRRVPTMVLGARDYALTLGLMIVIGVSYVVVGGVLYFLRPDLHTSSSLILLTANTSLYPLLMTLATNPRYSRVVLLPALLVQSWLGATCVHFGATFPTEQRAVSSRPWILGIPYAASALVALWAFLGLQRPGIPDLYPLYVNYVAVSGGCLLGLGLFVSSYWDETAGVARDRMKLLLPGVLISMGIPFVVFLYAALSRDGGLPFNFLAPAPMFLTAAFAYAIVRTDLYEMGESMKTACAYGIMTLGVIATYAISFLAVSWFAPGSEASIPFNGGFAVLVALFFGSVQHRVERLVERAFSGISPGHRSALVGVGSTITELLDVEEIVQQLSATVNDCFAPQKLAILLWLDDRTLLRRLHERSGQLEQAEPVEASAIRRQLASSPTRPWRVNTQAVVPESDAARREAVALDAAVLVPLSRGTTIYGALSLGQTRSGTPYTRVQLELLQTLASQGAIAIDNAFRVRTRTSELQVSNAALERAYQDLQGTQAQLLQTEKMASLGQLVAGVAHEINNPVTFIAGNIVPLQRTVRRIRELAAETGLPQLSSIADQGERIVDLMAQGAERTAAIVRDLRTFSRGGDEPAKPVDVHEGIDISLRLLGPRMEDRITVHRDYGHIPPVRMVSGQLNQVFMNLLANACDAIEGSGNIWISTARDDSMVRIMVRDDGVGIPKDRLARIFDPFFTTKPPGQGTGLGLSVSHGIVGRHGGKIEVRSSLGAGTVFEVWLPVAGPDGPLDQDCGSNADESKR